MQYIRETKPDLQSGNWTDRTKTLVAFLMGAGTHFMADELWEGMTGQVHLLSQPCCLSPLNPAACLVYRPCCLPQSAAALHEVSNTPFWLNMSRRLSSTSLCHSLFLIDRLAGTAGRGTGLCETGFHYGPQPRWAQRQRRDSSQHGCRCVPL